MCAKAVSSTFISNFSVVPWGGAAFNATQFSRQELLNKHSRYIMMKGFRLSIAQHFQSCGFMYLLLSIHVVFYCSLRLATRCLASTLVLKCNRAYLKLTVYGCKQANKHVRIHTHFRNAVRLVWGSLRLTL